MPDLGKYSEILYSVPLAQLSGMKENATIEDLKHSVLQYGR